MQENKALVSIIIPVYNMGEKLEFCVSSLLNQTYDNMEIVLVDDGSRDNSLAVANSLAEKNDKIKVFHTENRGSGPARNYGINAALGEYLYFPDADDFVDPKAIETFVHYAEATNADIVLSGYQNLTEDGKLISERKNKYTEVSCEEIRAHYAFYKVMSPELNICGAPWNKLFRKSVIDEFNIEYPPLRRHQDEGFIARFFSYAKRAVFIEEVLYKYYTNDQGLEWKKYPIDYLDAVTGLYEERCRNVLTWNPQDEDTKALIANEFICNYIKGLELSFSPKHNLKKKERKAWLREKIENSTIQEISAPSITGKYQRTVLKLIKKKCVKRLHALLRFKIFVKGKILKR